MHPWSLKKSPFDLTIICSQILSPACLTSWPRKQMLPLWSFVLLPGWMCMHRTSILETHKEHKMNDVKRQPEKPPFCGKLRTTMQCKREKQLIGKAPWHITGSLPLPETMSVSLIASFFTQPVIGESDVKASNFIAVRSHIEQLFCCHLRSHFRKEYILSYSKELKPGV
jgi:hypothetical protein